MKRFIMVRTFLVLALALSTCTTAPPAQAQITVRANGQRLATSVRPMMLSGRIFVPMRAIFEALGAKVSFYPLTRGIMAKRGTTDVNLQIGNRIAVVNQRNTRLEQGPIIRRGNTFVPLRFVSEALGAGVSWDARRQLVSINTTRVTR